MFECCLCFLFPCAEKTVAKSSCTSSIRNYINFFRKEVRTRNFLEQHCCQVSGLELQMRIELWTAFSFP